MEAQALYKLNKNVYVAD